MIRNIFLILILSLQIVLLSPLTYSACDNPADIAPQDFLKGCAALSPGSVQVTEGMGKLGTEALVVKIAERALQFGALFAIGVIAFSGMRYVTSAGEDEKLKAAKNTAIYAMVGLILTLSAFPLVDIVVNFIYSLGT